MRWEEVVMEECDKARLPVMTVLNTELRCRKVFEARNEIVFRLRKELGFGYDEIERHTGIDRVAAYQYVRDRLKKDGLSPRSVSPRPYVDMVEDAIRKGVFVSAKGGNQVRNLNAVKHLRKRLAPNEKIVSKSGGYCLIAC